MHTSWYCNDMAWVKWFGHVIILSFQYCDVFPRHHESWPKCLYVQFLYWNIFSPDIFLICIVALFRYIFWSPHSILTEWIWSSFQYVDQSVTVKACASLNGMKFGGQVLTVIQALPSTLPMVSGYCLHKTCKISFIIFYLAAHVLGNICLGDIWKGAKLCNPWPCKASSREAFPSNKVKKSGMPVASVWYYVHFNWLILCLVGRISMRNRIRNSIL